ADHGDRTLMGGAQGLVGGVPGDQVVVLDQRGRQLGIGQGLLGDALAVVLVAADVVPLAPGGVPAGEGRVPLGLVDRDRQASGPPGVVDAAPVARVQVASL